VSLKRAYSSFGVAGPRSVISHQSRASCLSHILPTISPSPRSSHVSLFAVTFRRSFTPSPDNPRHRPRFHRTTFTPRWTGIDTAPRSRISSAPRGFTVPFHPTKLSPFPYHLQRSMYHHPRPISIAPSSPILGNHLVPHSLSWAQARPSFSSILSTLF
jgi:hypothetical protein